MSRRRFAELAREATRQALNTTADYLEARFTEEISDPKWVWPTEPSPRDIVDTGALRSSQQRVKTLDGIAFIWGVGYSLQVHEGGTFRNGIRLPPRPWTREPLAEAPAVFQRELDAAIARLLQ